MHRTFLASLTSVLKPKTGVIARLQLTQRASHEAIRRSNFSPR